MQQRYEKLTDRVDDPTDSRRHQNAGDKNEHDPPRLPRFFVWVVRFLYRFEPSAYGGIEFGGVVVSHGYFLRLLSLSL